MPEHEAQDHLLSNTVYDRLKYTAQIGLPAAGTLYFTLAQIWGLPAAEQVVGTIVAIDTFLGVLLGFATKTFNESEAKFDGDVDMVPDPDQDVTNIRTSFKTSSLADKDVLVLKVKKH